MISPTLIASASATRLLAGLVVPDTPIVTRAIGYAREHCEPYLFNHSMRSWLFAVALAQLKQSPHDPEVLAVSAVLHDIGLVKAFDGPLRFEGRRAAAAHSLRITMPASRRWSRASTCAWSRIDSIRFHTPLQI